jgi:hypothetical protein
MSELQSAEQPAGPDGSGRGTVGERPKARERDARVVVVAEHVL